MPERGIPVFPGPYSVGSPAAETLLTKRLKSRKCSLMNPAWFFLFTILATAPVLPDAFAADDYKLGPDSMQQEGVPRGEVIKMPPWTNSTVFAGTHRDWWLYVPKQYAPDKPACVMVFQDGGGYVNINSNGQW